MVVFLYPFELSLRTACFDVTYLWLYPSGACGYTNTHRYGGQIYQYWIWNCFIIKFFTLNKHSNLCCVHWTPGLHYLSPFTFPQKYCRFDVIPLENMFIYIFVYIFCISSLPTPFSTVSHWQASHSALWDRLTVRFDRGSLLEENKQIETNKQREGEREYEWHGSKIKRTSAPCAVLQALSRVQKTNGQLA